jgi:TP901 family phage tail tape measure protein
MAEIAKGIIEVEINTGSASSELKALLAQINAFQLALNKGNVDQAAFTAKFSKALQQAINQTGSFTAETIRLQTAAATLDKTLTKGKTSLGQFFSAKYNKNSAIAAETMALASERARRLQTQFIATSAAANGFQDALAVRPLAAFSTEAAIAGQKAQIMSSMFKQGTTQLINFGKNVQWAGRQLMVGFTVPLTIFGAVAGKTFMDLEKQVVGFKKVYGDLFTTPAELNQNLEAVKGLAAEYTKYGIAVKDTIGLASQAAAAGRQGTELTDSVTQATRLATLGQMDQNAALETTISLQSAFRLSGQDLADTINFLNMVENQTVVSLQDISAAIPRVAPVIQGLGGDVKDLTVFLAAMQEGGVDAAEGANALKSGLASLINPTKQATAMLSGMGINLQSIIEANKGDLMGTVQSFAQALASLDQFSRQQALEQVFGKFQYAKLGALFENISREGSQAQQVIATLGYSTEQLAATADKELKTIEESFGVQLTGAIERFKLAIAPIGEIFVKLAIPLVNLATKIAEAFNGLSDGQKKFAAIGAVIVGIVVPAVTMLTGLFLNLVGTLAKMGQGISLFGMGLIKGGPLGAIKAVTQSAKYLSLAEMDAAMAAQQLIGPTQILNETLVKQAMVGNTAAASIGNLTKAYAAMIATQAGATRDFPEVFGAAGAAGVSAKTSQVVIRGVQKRNSGGPIFMSNGTTVPGSGNTDTVPAMLTPGEFVVNKEATKNNLGLLHNINDSKNPQGLNVGGKAKGIQYLNIGNAVKAWHARQAAKSASRIGGNRNLTPRDLDSLMDEPHGFGELLGRDSQVVSRAPVSSSPDLQKSHLGGNENIQTIARFQELFGTKTSNRWLFARDLLSHGIPIEGLSNNWSKILKTINQAANRGQGKMTLDDAAIAMRDSRGLISFDQTTAFRQAYPEVTEKEFGRKMAMGLLRYKSRLDASGKPIGNVDLTDDILETVARDAYPNVEDSTRIVGLRIPAKKDISNFIKESGGPELSSLPGDAQKFATDANVFFKERNLPFQVKQIVPSNPNRKPYWVLETERDGVTYREKFGASTPYNAGGKVPGYNAGALIGKSLRRRVRPGKEERLAQQSALHNFAFDSRNVRETPEMDTILGMMNPLTQKTRATRGTVLGSTSNKELPYAQQKKIVSAIKEGRYEDLFGMKLNFKGGAGSYTTKRDLDFSPFIGDLSNPTLKDFSYGFMGLDTQKKDISRLRKIMKTPKIKKLTPGTAEYARELAMAGWSPARSFRPGPNPTIGSDWTFEQVLANKTREYNNAKKRLNKTFPDKKIQQLFIDEMVGSGVLALDVQKASYKHPVMSDRNNRVKRLRAKEHELLVGNRTSEITGVASDLRTRLPSLITQSGVQGFNQGNIVPGMGNTDTVPAMLTPGEFVVNKESTKNNYDLLTAINGSQKLNKGGMAGVQYFAKKEPERVVQEQKGAKYFSNKGQGAKISGRSTGVGGMLSGIAPMAAGLGASMLPMAMAPEMGMFGQIAASTAAFSAAQKSVTAVLMKFQKVSLKAVDSTGQVGEGFKKLFPQLSKLSPNILKFIGPLSGAGAAIALVGFGAYKLNKQINDASKAGGKLAAAMYGTADSTNAIAETFGRQTRAQQAMVAAAEKATGQEVSEESQQVSSQFMQSDAGKALLKDISFVESSGKDAATALRNQLSQAIIAGAITAEEARAIAIDIGTALENERLAVEVSGKISQLMGPNGEKLTAENILKIQAEITPSVDISQIRDDAKSAYDDLNQMQKIFSVFKGGSAGFENQYKLEEVLTVNNSALSAQLNTVEFLNAAFKEGTITLENYKKALDDSKNVTGNTLDANAQILGFENNQALTATADIEAQKKQDSILGFAWIESPALKAIENQKTQVKTMLEESGAYSEEAINKIIKDFEEVGSTSWGKLLTGEWSPTDAQMVINFQTQGLTTEEIDELVFKLGVIESLPDITTVIDFKNPNPKAIEELYSTYEQLQSAAAKGPLTQEVLVKATGMNIFNSEIMSAINALPASVSIPIIMSVAWDTETNKKLNAKEGTSEEQKQTLESALLNKLKVGIGNLGPKPGTTSGDKSGGNNKEENLLKMLMERFRLQEMLIDKEAEGFNERLKQLNREIELEERQVNLRQKGLEQLSKKEEAVNDAYNLRVEALDKVLESNSRVNEQEKSRISLASALASGDIAAAAGIAGDMQQQSAQYQIEDTRAALEKQRQTDLDALTVSINGKLMTRKGIESEIETIQDRIYSKGIELQGVQDKLLGFEQRKLDVAKEREKVETRMYLIEQQKTIDALKKKTNLSKADQAALVEYESSLNMYNAANPGANVDPLNSAATKTAKGAATTKPKPTVTSLTPPTPPKVASPAQQTKKGVLNKLKGIKMAYGGVAYKGSREAPPALRMNNGFTVPGTGMTDKVSALLTPGEFVVRKSVADQNRGFLNQLNSQVFPAVGKGISSPTYSIPGQSVTNIPVNTTNVVSNSSPMYNSTYNVNVNVSGTNASPDDIANVVMAKLSNQNRGNLRSNRY